MLITWPYLDPHARVAMAQNPETNEHARVAEDPLARSS